MAIDRAREFPHILKQQKIEELLRGIERTTQGGGPDLQGFAEGLLRKRIKLIKRMMYGRAKFDLLRIRVLARGT